MGEEWERLTSQTRKSLVYVNMILHLDHCSHFCHRFDLFESFFGSGFGGRQTGQRSRAVPGEDERYELQMEFLDAVFGATKEIDVDRLASCSVGVVKPLHS